MSYCLKKTEWTRVVDDKDPKQKKWRKVYTIVATGLTFQEAKEGRKSMKDLEIFREPALKPEGQALLEGETS